MGKSLKIFLISVTAFVFIYGIYYFGIPAIINLPKRQAFIENEILKESGIPLKIANPSLKMGILPSLIIKAGEINLKGKNNEVALDIKNPYFKIELFPLLFNKLDIEKFSADNVYINLTLPENFELELGQYCIKDIKIPFKVDKVSTNIKNLDINLYDKILNKTIKLKSKSSVISKFINNKEVSFDTNLSVITNKIPAEVNLSANLKLPLTKINPNQIYLKGYINNLNLTDFTSYVKYFSKGKFQKVSGLINLKADTEQIEKSKVIKESLSVDNFGLYQKDKFKSVFFKDKLNIESSLNILKNGLEINDASITGKGVNIGLNGDINNITSKNPEYDINLMLNKSRTEAFIPLLPGEENLIPDINLYILKKNYLYGDVSGALNISGKAPEPDITGDVLVNNAYLVKPAKNAKKANIRLQFMKDKLNIDVKVPTGPYQAVYVKGPIELYEDKYAELDITSTNKVDLEFAEFVLNPLHDILNFEIGPVPIMKIKGSGGINLKVTGNKTNPHAFGKFYFKNATVEFNDVNNMTVTNGSGDLIFKDGDTEFKTKSAFLNGKPISINGICNLFGVFDFKVKTSGQDLGNLVKILKTSPMLVDMAKMTHEISQAGGLTDFYLNLTGKVKNPKDMKFLKNVFAKGSIKLLGNQVKIADLPTEISNIIGFVDYDNTNVKLNLISSLNNSKILLKGSVKNNFADLKVVSDKFNLKDAISFLPKNIKLPYKNDINKIKIAFDARYRGDVTNINPKNIYLKGKIFTNAAKDTVLVVNNSNFEIKNSNMRINNLSGKVKDNPYFISLNTTNAFDSRRNINGSIKFKQLNLNLVEDIIDIMPQGIAEQVKNFKDINGTADINAKIVNNKIKAYTVLDDINFFYEPKNMKFTIVSGNIFMNGNEVNLNKINTKLGGMPVFVNGKVSNIFKTPYLNLYFNTKPSQDFLDRYVNNKMVYPIKVKGDINLTSYVKGFVNNINSKSTLKLSPNSSIYYMGSTLGDVENSVEINSDANYSKNHLTINKFDYDKIIESQNNKPFLNKQLTASGSIDLLKNNELGFKNLRVKTFTPTDAKIFNIVFKKPTMKQGVFTADLTVNGSSLNPKAVGKLDITSIDMPFYNSTIKDINMDLKNDKILVNSKGVILSNDVNLEAVMKNKLTSPFVIEDVKLNLKDLNVDTITDALRDYEVEATKTQNSNSTQNLDLSQFTVNNAEIFADKVKAKNISATNFEASGSLNEKMLLKIDKYKFNIAQGRVSGNSYYNLLTHSIGMKMHMENANAQIMSEALFDLKDQIYGSVTGDVDLMCSGKSHKRCMQTLQGDGYFIASDGKMPKLGSLEYLLKAGNLLTTGITGLSINGIIDLITPLKTGEFESISGDFHILNGIAQRINIYSKGDDLNMYMTGAYNFSTAIADMRIFGSLSKNISTVFSKIKNASLNTLFNTIPGISSNENTKMFQTEIAKIPAIKNQASIYKIFTVDIYGDINGNNYVKSFKWVK